MITVCIIAQPFTFSLLFGTIVTELLNLPIYLLPTGDEVAFWRVEASWLPYGFPSHFSQKFLTPPPFVPFLK